MSKREEFYAIYDKELERTGPDWFNFDREVKERLWHWHQSKMKEMLNEIKKYIEDNDGGDGLSQTGEWIRKLDQMLKEMGE